MLLMGRPEDLIFLFAKIYIIRFLINLLVRFQKVAYLSLTVIVFLGQNGKAPAEAV